MNEQRGGLKIFITGGAGFVGANLTRYLLDRESWAVTVYDNLSVCPKENLDRAVTASEQEGELTFMEGDILDFDSVSNAMAGHDFVVHLAAHTQVRESIERPRAHLSANAEGTLNVIEAARRQGVGKFVFASSNAAVGEQIPPVNESMIARPLAPYGAAKLYGEALCSAYYHSYGLKTAALRFANVYGPYSDHKTSVVAKFLRLVKEGQDIEIYGNGMQTRDFIHAQDIAQAIHRVVICDKSGEGSPWGEVFQIATGEETRIIDMARIISNFGNSKQESIKFTDSVKGEIRRNFSDISRSRKILGFSPNMDMMVELQKL